MFSRYRWSFYPSELSKHHSDRNRDRHRRHSNQRDSSPEERVIRLIDLDYTLTGRRYVPGRVKDTTQLSDVAEHLRAKFWNGDQRLPEDAEIQFFWDSRRLDGDEIPKDASTLHYRVLPAGDDGSLRVVWKGVSLRLRRAQLGVIADEVAAGRSVGSIRQTIVDLLRVSNKDTKDIVQTPNQIEIGAAGGLRPGPLEGNNWEARKVQDWLCRYLTIELKRPGNYLVLKAFNEEYVWHKPSVNSRGHVEFRDIKLWLKQAVLTAVHLSRPRSRRRSDGIHVDLGDIKLKVRGKPLGKHTYIRPGKTLEFDVPRVVEDKFLQAEAWLVPLTETCIVCSDEKRVSEMPNRRRVTASCEHDATICKECVGLWITSSMDTLSWDRLKCPECPQLLKYENVQAFASRETLDKYNTLATKAFLSDLPEFMWCLNPKCNSGHIHPTGCSKAKCPACKHSLCVRHHVPWHSGETCDEYDRRTKIQRKNEKASEKHVKEIAKPCPGCKKNVHKFDGCDHVTCICGHEWCWLCFGTYYHDEQGFLQCRHTQECRYRENPPNYEGGRAFMPFLPPARGPPPGPPGMFVNGPLPPGRAQNVAPPPGIPRGAPGFRPPRPPVRPLPDDGHVFVRHHVPRPLLFNANRPRPPQQQQRPDFVEQARIFHMGHLAQRAERER
ncbi:hypothetical protein GGR53DRAFT_499500 [Hypoxylon sp. FL1150]|nr:hypothetical protein GGR53DRAFT_499500 [Hypoxylon sp. FL1150]